MRKLIGALLFLAIGCSTVDTPIEEVIQVEEKIVEAVSDYTKFVVYRTETGLSLNLDYNLYLTIDSMIVAHELPKDITFKQINQESRFRKGVKSRVGAVGLMQIMPKTFKWMKKRLKKPGLNINNPEDNLYVGMMYIKYLTRRVEKSSPKASEEYKQMLILSSYNAGYSRRYRALKKFPETIHYVDVILN